MGTKMAEATDTGCLGVGHRSHRLTSEENLARAATLFSALADPSRLRLLEILADGPHCVGALADEMGHSMSLVSQRLKILYGSNLVTKKRVGKHVYYELADGHVANLLSNGLDHVIGVGHGLALQEIQSTPTE